MCYFVAIAHLFFQSSRIVRSCGGHLLNVTFSFSSAIGMFGGHCFCDQNFLYLRHRRYIAGLRMLHKVNSNSNHCLFSEVPSASTVFDMPSCGLSSSIGVRSINVYKTS